MKLTWILVVAALGCGKKDGGNEAAKTTDKPAPAFSGTLTADAIMGAKGLVKPFDKWDDGFAKLQATFGPPTNTKGDNFRWAVQTGDDCTYFYVSKDDGKKMNMGDGFIVGTVMTPMKVNKTAGPSGNYDECLAILGKDSGPPEDPSALPPPADGKATPALIADNAIKARSKWKGAKLTITGTVTQISTSSSGSKTWTTLTLADDKDKTKAVTCTMETPATAKWTSGKPVTVTATLDIAKWTSGAGDELRPDLKDCVVAP